MASGTRKPGGGVSGGSGSAAATAWWSSSSYKATLVFIIPLLLVLGLISLLNPNSSNRVFISNYYLTNPSPITSSGNSSEIGAKRDDFSALPPLAVEEEATPPLLEQPVFNVTKKNEEPINETDAPAIVDNPATKQKEKTNLEWLESRLRRARVAIREARFSNKTYDADYIPNGPMYWNANVFQRSYLEMEKRFKVFVYEEGEQPLFHNGPCKSTYSIEGNFIHEIEVNKQFRTRNPEEAHVYFLPYSVTMLVRFVYIPDSHDYSLIKKTVKDYINVISTKYPYWNRSLAADHLTLACHDWGPETSNSDLYLSKNSIRGLCNANTSEGFDPSKDVSCPEINLQTGDTHGFLGGPSPRLRSILAFFAGGVHGPIRPILLHHWENKDEDLRVHQYLPKGVSYYDMMKKSRFCLCPSGYEVASPRVMEAIYTGCVPVLISDHYVRPFGDVLNWKAFSVEVSVSDIPNLKNILTSISTRQYLRMHRRVVEVRRHFEFNSPPKRFDVFHMILHSIWLRRLNVIVHDDQ